MRIITGSILVSLFAQIVGILLFFSTAPAQDTFSIVVVDTVTGELGSAGASCIAGAQVITDIIEGVGAINTQAYWLPQNQQAAHDRMLEGLMPQEIINWLTENDAQGDSTVRQYGIVANGVSARSAAYTGVNTDDWKGHIIGPNYAIQGNILLGPEIIESMEIAYLNTEGDLPNRLMAALEAAKVPGADIRCLSSGRSAISAFIRVVRIGDGPDEYLFEIVSNTPTDIDPIDSLRVLFNIWCMSQGPVRLEQVTVSQSYATPGIDSVIVTASANVSLGLTLFAEIEAPDNTPLDTVPLFDDGAHHDGEAGDSLFGNAWAVPPVEERIHFVDLHVSYVDTETVSCELGNIARFTTIGPIVFEDYTILGPDPFPNPSESVFFTLTLGNNGLVTTANKVRATISTSDTCITSLNPINADYGNILAGASSFNLFSVEINSNCATTEHIHIPFDIEISSGGIVWWTDIFDFIVFPKGIAGLEDIMISSTYTTPGNEIEVVARLVADFTDNIIIAEIQSPDATLLETLQLLDDGAHNDESAGDNIFGNAWSVPDIEEKMYYVDLKVTSADTLNFEIDNAALFTSIGPIVVESIDVLLRTEGLMDFRATLKNDGLLTAATDIEAKITTSDSCITNINTDTATFGDIAAGERATSSVDYSVDLIANCTDIGEFTFNFDISSEGTLFWSDTSVSFVIVGLEGEISGIPLEYSLSQAYPNPFNPTTTIEYSLPQSGEVSLIIYNLLGQEIAHLTDERKPAGRYTVEWNASNFTSGIYFYRLQAGNFVQTRKMVLLK